MFRTMTQVSIALCGGDFEINYQTSRLYTKIAKSRGTKVEVISFARISTSFVKARQSRKAMQADYGEQASPPSSQTAAQLRDLTGA